MGLWERLCMVLRGKTSTMTIFQPLFNSFAARAAVKYGSGMKKPVSRYCDGGSYPHHFCNRRWSTSRNNKTGYVIRRILSTCSYVAFTFLNFKNPSSNKLVSCLADQFKDVFPKWNPNRILFKRLRRRTGFLAYAWDQGFKFEETKTRTSPDLHSFRVTMTLLD